MRTKVKMYMLKALYSYHYHMANYCYGKVDSYGPEHNDYWGDKVAKHVHKELELVNKYIQLGESC